MDVLNRLQDIFRVVFDEKNLVLTKETTANDIEEWDSLAQINIIVACEEEFNTKFDLNDVKKLKKVGDMQELIERKLKNENTPYRISR